MFHDRCLPVLYGVGRTSVRQAASAKTAVGSIKRDPAETSSCHTGCRLTCHKGSYGSIDPNY
jgi:hypothetical protein